MPPIRRRVILLLTSKYAYPSYDQEDLQDPDYAEEDPINYGKDGGFLGSEPDDDFDNDGWED